VDQPAPPPDGRPTREVRRDAILLAAVLGLAAVLRFGALGAGLRHEPHVDERYFVENVGWMLAERDLDHRFDEYPALVFYLLAPVLAWFGPPRFGPEAYLAARAVVASFGVASVGLVFVLGTRLSSRTVGLVAALLLAVSPVEVQTAHMVRPDVVLEAFVLVACLALLRVGARTRGDVVAGGWLGAVAAVKFTGGLLVISYLARRLLTPGARWRGIAIAGLTSILVFGLCSPHTILDLRGGAAGLATQVGYHYDVRPRGEQSYLGMVATYGIVLERALGVVAVLLAVAGVWLARRDWRRWLPLWLFPLAIVAVFSTAEVHHDRFVVPALALVALTAAEGARRAAGRWVWVLGACAAAWPLAGSVDYVRGIRVPSTRDRALGWVEANVEPGALVVTTLPDLGVPRDRYRVLSIDGIDGARARLLAAHADVAIGQAGVDDQVLAGLSRILGIEPTNRHAGPTLLLVRANPPVRYAPIDLRAARVTTSEAPDRAGALTDGDPATSWTTSGPQGSDWIDVVLPRPERIGRIELRVPGRGRLFGRNVHVSVEGADGALERVAVVSGAPPIDPGGTTDPRQVLLFEPVVTAHVRLTQVAEAGKAWGVAELTIDRRLGE
jgi:4-amino-4-deoxy-L-arabinose transferase-like glycosyltransferase